MPAKVQEETSMVIAMLSMLFILHAGTWFGDLQTSDRTD